MKRIISFFTVLLLLTGCWDRIEIEERGFVVGAAIDSEKENKILLTQQLINPKAMNGSSSSQGGEGGNKSYLNVKETGDSVFEIVRGVATNSSRTPYYGHTKVIVISSDIAESDKMAETLDYFIRNPVMRRSTILAISRGKATDILDVKPKIENAPAMYIKSISENNYKNAEILPKVRLGDVHEYLLSNKSFVITMIERNKEKLDLSGVAIMHGKTNTMVGTLNRDETVALNYVTNEIDGGFIKTFHEEKPILYDIYNFHSDVEVQASDKNNISFTIKIRTEGGLAETFLSQDYLNEETFTAFEEAIKKEILQKSTEAVEKAQNEYKVDYLNLGEYLRQNNYKLWNEVKDDWDSGENYFSSAKIDFDVQVRVRTTGSVNKSKDE